MKDFHNQPVVLRLKEAQELEGNLSVESSGLELTFNKDYSDRHNRSSYLLYKNEYPNIIGIVRRCSLLNAEQNEARSRYVNTNYYTTLRRSSLRRLRNLFNTFRDSFLEAASLLIGQISKGGIAPQALGGQQKYMGKIKEEVIGSLGRAYDPLLEKHIGQRVIVIEKSGEESKECTGVFKEYTQSFLEILDIDLEGLGKVDIVFPRATATVRFLAG